MIDQETRRKMRIIGVPEALDIMDAMAADPSYANMGFDERVRVIVGMMRFMQQRLDLLLKGKT